MQVKDGGPIKADPRIVPQGLNNNFMKKVSFEFSQVDLKTARAVFTDPENARFSIPDNLVPRPGPDASKRLDSQGF
jgi:hypothetical protein